MKTSSQWASVRPESVLSTEQATNRVHSFTMATPGAKLLMEAEKAMALVAFVGFL